MKTIKYIIASIVLVFSLMGCSENVKDMPPRVTDVNNEFRLPSPPKLTNAESDMVQAKRDAYNEAYGD